MFPYVFEGEIAGGVERYKYIARNIELHMYFIEGKAHPPPPTSPSSLILGTFGQHQSPCWQYWELQAVCITAL